MKQSFVVPTAFALGCVMALAVAYPPRGAKSAPAEGLFAEKSIEVDGVVVRRVRDTGAHTVCYVATGPGKSGYYGTPLTISCVRESP